MALLEVACFQPGDALIAYEAGADRLELCDDRESGGITPPREWLAQIKSSVTIPVFVMIRPRGGDFCYSNQEFDRMKRDVDAFMPDADGYVLGLLKANHQVDVARTAELVQRAHPLQCTFHRAFDETPDPLHALEDVINTGCSAVLTSGGGISAMAGLETLGLLVRMSRGRITVMPGGGVRAQNISGLRAYSHASVFHSSGIIKGDSEPSGAEIQRMKALLAKPVLHEAGSVSTAGDAEDDDEEPLAMSAVSLGQGTSGGQLAGSS